MRVLWWRWRQHFTIRVELLLVVTRVRHSRSGEFLKTRIFPLRVLSIMIDVEDTSVRVTSFLPAGWQRTNATLEVKRGLRWRFTRARINPRGCLVDMIDEKHATTVRVGKVPAWWQWRLVRLRTYACLLSWSTARRVSSVTVATCWSRSTTGLTTSFTCRWSFVWTHASFQIKLEWDY